MYTHFRKGCTFIHAVCQRTWVDLSSSVSPGYFIHSTGPGTLILFDIKLSGIPDGSFAFREIPETCKQLNNH